MAAGGGEDTGYPVAFVDGEYLDAGVVGCPRVSASGGGEEVHLGACHRGWPGGSANVAAGGMAGYDNRDPCGGWGVVDDPFGCHGESNSVPVTGSVEDTSAVAPWRAGRKSVSSEHQAKRSLSPTRIR